MKIRDLFNNFMVRQKTAERGKQMVSPKRGMQNLHTMAGRADGPVKPHKAYLRISCLEMEKARLDTERAAAQKRIDRIKVRTLEIDAEKKSIMESLPALELRAVGNMTRQDAPSTPANKGKGKRGMAFRY